MSSVSLETVRPREESSFAFGFFFTALALAVAAASLAGWAPLGFSIVTVFLFAGPHNWLEAWYFLSRLPARWGKLRGFFLLGFAGIFGLTVAFIALRVAARMNLVDQETLFVLHASWNSLLIGWITLLIHIRSRQGPRRDWSWTVPVAWLLAALTWLNPGLWSLGLVYAHPLVAFWVLDRELARNRPEWCGAWRACLATLPILVVLLCWQLAGAPALQRDSALSVQIARQAGESVLLGISSHLLVALHAFLEMLHYAVWLIAVPVVSLRAAPWRLDVPLARRSVHFKSALLGLLLAGGVVVLVLWGCFLADYQTTRDVYFLLALLHVLAEVPFLLRAL